MSVLLSVPEECELCSIPSLSESLKFSDDSCREPYLLLDLRLHTCRIDLQRGPLRSVLELEFEVMEATGCPSHASAPPWMARSWVNVFPALGRLGEPGSSCLRGGKWMALHHGLSPATPQSRLRGPFCPGSGQLPGLLVPVVGTVFGVLWHCRDLLVLSRLDSGNEPEDMGHIHGPSWSPFLQQVPLHWGQYSQTLKILP